MQATTNQAAASNPRRERRIAVARAALNRWRNDPVAFAVEVLGVHVWSRQAEILRLATQYNRISVRSGHKVGKSKAVALLALWWAATRSEARVVLLAPSYRQITEIVWMEIKRTHAAALHTLGGEVLTSPEGGIRWRDGRQIFGFSTDSKERVAGFSGQILYVLDEASGVPDEVHEVCSTNPVGTVVAISNPTRASGAFYDQHHTKSLDNGGVWKSIRISSEEAAAENTPIPGHPGRYRYKYLANQEWIDARRREFGEGSPYYDIRVRGEFAKQSDNATIPAGLVDEAIERWPETRQDGRLELGVDVARFGADDSSIVWRRGYWSSPPAVKHGNDNVEIANEVRRVAREQRRPGERPRVKVDTSNGGGVADILRRDDDLEVVDVMAQEAATEREYARKRDQVWFGLRKWLKNGGAISGDVMLANDLKAPTFDYDEKAKIKVESKRELRKRLGRSTDRGDALALAVFEPESATWDPIIVGGSTR